MNIKGLTSTHGSGLAQPQLSLPQSAARAEARRLELAETALGEGSLAALLATLHHDKEGSDGRFRKLEGRQALAVGIALGVPAAYEVAAQQELVTRKPEMPPPPNGQRPPKRQRIAGDTVASIKQGGIEALRLDELWAACAAEPASDPHAIEHQATRFRSIGTEIVTRLFGDGSNDLASAALRLILGHLNRLADEHPHAHAAFDLLGNLPQQQFRLFQQAIVQADVYAPHQARLKELGRELDRLYASPSIDLASIETRVDEMAQIYMTHQDRMAASFFCCAIEELVLFHHDSQREGDAWRVVDFALHCVARLRSEGVQDAAITEEPSQRYLTLLQSYVRDCVTNGPRARLVAQTQLADLLAAFADDSSEDM
jgi:hypothetical protein